MCIYIFMYGWVYLEAKATRGVGKEETKKGQEAQATAEVGGYMFIYVLCSSVCRILSSKNTRSVYTHHSINPSPPPFHNRPRRRPSPPWRRPAGTRPRRGRRPRRRSRPSLRASRVRVSVRWLFDWSIVCGFWTDGCHKHHPNQSHHITLNTTVMNRQDRGLALAAGGGAGGAGPQEGGRRGAAGADIYGYRHTQYHTPTHRSIIPLVGACAWYPSITKPTHHHHRPLPITDPPRHPRDGGVPRAVAVGAGAVPAGGRRKAPEGAGGAQGGCKRGWSYVYGCTCVIPRRVYIYLRPLTTHPPHKTPPGQEEKAKAVKAAEARLAAAEQERGAAQAAVAAAEAKEGVCCFIFLLFCVVFYGGGWWHGGGRVLSARLPWVCCCWCWMVPHTHT